MSKKQLLQFANSLIFHYGKFDDLDDCFVLSLNDIPDFDLHAFAAKILSNDETLASEATGPDNPLYDKKMLPALINHMKDTTNSSLTIDFATTWQESITKYVEPFIQELIDEALENYNNEKGCTKPANQIYGVPLHEI